MGVAAITVHGRVGSGSVRHPQLVALVHEHHAGQREDQHRRRPHRVRPDAIRKAREVVVGEHPREPALRTLEGQRTLDRRPQRHRREVRLQELEGEGDVDVP